MDRVQPIKVEAREGYRIWFEYADGVAGELNRCPDALYMELTGCMWEEMHPRRLDGEAIARFK